MIGTFSKNGVTVLFFFLFNTLFPHPKNLIILKLTKLFFSGNKITFQYTRIRAFRKLNIF